MVLYDPESGEARVIGVEQGLSNNTVPGLIEDDDGNIWANTFKGVSVVNVSGKVVVKLFEEDGLVNNEGNRWSSYKHRDGRIVFGSMGGFTIIDPARVLSAVREQAPPRLSITQIQFSTGNGSTREVLNPPSRSEITLPAYNRNLTLSLSLSDLESESQNEFMYRIDLPGYDWTTLGGTMPATISNLPGGTYSLLLRGRNSIGILSSNVAEITLHVKRPFIKTPWFIVLLVLPVLVSIGIWLFRSIRDRRRLENEVKLRTADIERQADELRQMDKMKSRIYTNITHEFRTPLTVIKGVAQQSNGDLKSNGIVRRNADRLLNLVNQMLDLSKLESGTLEARFVSGNVVDVARNIFDSFAPLAEGKNIGMHFYARPEIIVMDYDVDVVFRIVGNLMSNAVKYTPVGGNIYLELRRNVDELEISVRDTGIGIAPEKIAYVFNRFYQVDDSMTRAGEGTGVGLSLTKELVEFLGGRISVESKLDRGSLFTVVLPVHNEAAKHANTNEDFKDNLIVSGEAILTQNERISQTNTSLPTVLVVEDTPDLLHYITECLKDEYNVILAMDGQAGIDKAIQEVPDIVISDVMMPIKDGLQLCTEVKQADQSSHIPVILLTAKADKTSRLEGLEAGADGYLAKPFDKEVLKLTIKNALNSSYAIRSRYSGDAEIPKSTNPVLKRQDDFVMRLNAVIDQNLEDEDFGVMPLSRAMKYSRSQLHKKVKALTGYSISSYIQIRRLTKAKALLRSPEMNISEAAWAVGFKDPKYFSRLFKREFGLSPSEYAEQDE